jgi:hypothetical protein
MQQTDPSPIVGVFRDHAKAEQAVDELKQAGFREDQIRSTVVNLQTAPEVQTPENSRVVITVNAEGKDRQAFGILFNNGANNADLPPGMALKHSKIVDSEAETVALIPEQQLEAEFDKESYFGEVKGPASADEPFMGDTH